MISGALGSPWLQLVDARSRLAEILGAAVASFFFVYDDDGSFRREAFCRLGREHLFEALLFQRTEAALYAVVRIFGRTIDNRELVLKGDVGTLFMRFAERSCGR